MSESVINIGMIGLGTVGCGVAKLLSEEASLYAERCGSQLRLRRILVRDLAKARTRNLVPPELLTDDPEVFFATGIDVLIEVAGGRGVISDHVRRGLTQGLNVVTANKSLLAAEGAELFALARAHNACIAVEASCGGGIPIMTAVQFGLMANRIRGLYGILNGTCNYILTQMTQQNRSYAESLGEAQQLGFAEADPTLDVSGRDAAQKLAVLASLAFGVRADEQQVWSEGIDTLDLADIRFAAELGYDIKLLAIGEQTDKGLSLRVHPCFIHADEPLAQVHGSFNALSVFGHANGHTMYYGRGAGQLPTASAVVGDLLNVASGWYPAAFGRMNLWCDRKPAAAIADAAELLSRYYLRVNALDVPGVMAKITKALGDAGISISAVLQHEVAAGQFVPVVIVTHEAREGAVASALEAIRRNDAIHGEPVRIRIVDMPKG